MTMKPFLRIVRLPNVITAACNSLAGAFCAGISIERWPVLAGLAVVSMTIYAAGILLNDLFDLEEDRRERPNRPLPAGEIRTRTVSVVAIVLIVAGLVSAFAISVPVSAVALALVASVLGYDAGLKRTFLGPFVMGLCRGLNFGLGLVAVPGADTWLWLAAVGYLLYIAGITYISRQETYVGQTKGLRAGYALIVAGFFAVVTVIFLKAGYRLVPSGLSVESWRPVAAIILLSFLLKSLTARWIRALRDPRPATIMEVVKTGIISLPLLDFAQTLAIAGVLKAIVIAALWLMARAAAKTLYAT
jgi:4-hydroxybenzoate polyprenyltransferase